MLLVWRSQLPEEGWRVLIHALELHRGWDGDRRILRLRTHQTTKQYAAHFDPYWTYNFGPGCKYRQRGGRFSWIHDYGIMRTQSHFLCDAQDDNVAHALEPLSGNLDTMITTFHDFSQGRPVSAANALITLWLTATQEKSPEKLAVAYDPCLAIAIHGFAPSNVDTRAHFRTHFLRQLATDVHRLPASWLGDTIKQIKEAGQLTDKEGPELVRMAKEILPELMAEDPPRPL